MNCSKLSSSLPNFSDDSKTCNEERKRLPASLFLTNSSFATSFLKLGKEISCESSGTVASKSETSLIASLRSSRSGFVTPSFDESAHRASSFLSFTHHRRLYWTSDTSVLSYHGECLLLWNLEPSVIPVMRVTTNSRQTLIVSVVSLNGLGPLPPCLLSGPTSSKPIYVISDPTSYSLWPRSVSPILLANRLIMFISRGFFNQNGVSLQFRYLWDTLTFIWRYYYQCIRFPLRNLSRVISEEQLFVKPMLVFRLPPCQEQFRLSRILLLLMCIPDVSFIVYFRKPVRPAIFQYPQPTIVNSCAWLPPSRKFWGYLRHISNSCFRAPIIYDLEGPRRPSISRKTLAPLSSFMERTFASPSSYMERTLSSYMERTPSSYMERTLATSYNLWLPVFEPRKQPIFHTILLLCVEILVPARFKVLESSSTSLCQSTVTNISPPEVLVEVPSTHQEFACANVLFSYRLQVLVDLKSYYLIYLCIVLLNVLLFHVLNFGSLNPLYPCIVL